MASARNAWRKCGNRAESRRCLFHIGRMNRAGELKPALRLFCLILTSLLMGSSCQPTAAPPAAVVPAASSSSPTRAQPKLPTIKLWLGAQELVSELALSSLQIQTGMMFRTNLAENAGMLFVFSDRDRRGFWMKNCPHPLSCAYIDSEGVILETYDMKPHDESPILSKSDQIQYVLEVNQGWFKRNSIAAGAVIRTERGALRESFFRR